MEWDEKVVSQGSLGQPIRWDEMGWDCPIPLGALLLKLINYQTKVTKRETYSTTK
jgi:hypothetical protein